MAEKCKKTFCLKQVNPNIPDLYFATPFKKDEDRGECLLCELGEKKEEVPISTRFTRGEREIK